MKNVHLPQDQPNQETFEQKKQQTAVEWLINKHFGGIENCTPDFRFHIQQALEMEKYQIVNAHLDGQSIDEKQRYGASDAKQYYNETYKK